MKRFARITSLVLALLMVVGLLPMTVLAQGATVVTPDAPVDSAIITRMSATVDTPVAGKTPDWTASAGSNVYSTTVERWFRGGSEGRPGENMASNETFASDTVYIVQITFTPLNGNTFSANPIATINGIDGYLCGTNTITGARTYRVLLTQHANRTVINSVVFKSSVDTPQYGDNVQAPTLYSVNGSTQLVSLLKSYVAIWFYNDEYSNDPLDYTTYLKNTFEFGNAYDLTVKMTAADNALFSKACTVTVIGPDEELQLTRYTDYAGSNVRYDIFFDDLMELEVFSVILSSPVSRPVVGQSTYSPTIYAVNGDEALAGVIDDMQVSWYCSDAFSTNASSYSSYTKSIFEDKAAYDMRAQFTVSGDVEFSDSCFLMLLVPGGYMEGRMNGTASASQATFDVFFNMPKEIRSIELQANVKSPENGKNVYSPTLKSVNGDTSLSSLIDSCEMRWYYSDTYSTDPDDYNDELTSSTFGDHAAYNLHCAFTSADGAEFIDDCTISIVTPDGTVTGHKGSLIESTCGYFEFFFDMTKVDTRTEITSIELTTNVVKPTVGAPLYYPTVESVNGNKALASLITDLDADWYYYSSYTTAANNYNPFFGPTFELGWAYDLLSTAYISEEAKFADTVTFTLKTPSGGYSGYLWEKFDDEISFDFFFDLTGKMRIRRLFGNNRFDTSVSISKDGWGFGAQTVVLASGENYPDALAGTILAGCYEAPILLTAKNALSEQVLAEIERLEPNYIILLGGTSAISQSIEDELKESYSVKRIYGNNRNATAAAISAEISPDSGVAFIVSNANFADALSAGAAASLADSPILYANPDGTLPQETIDALRLMNCHTAYIIGGTAAVGSAAETHLTSLGITPKRLYGSNRFLTSIAVYNEFDSLFNAENIAIATGLNYPDALAGVALASYYRMPVFLVGNTAPAELITLKNRIGTKGIYIFGGTGVVPDSVVDELC